MATACRSTCARMKTLIDTARFTSEAYKPPPPERVGGDLLDINWFNHCKSYLLNSSQVVLPPLVRGFYGALSCAVSTVLLLSAMGRRSAVSH